MVRRSLQWPKLIGAFIGLEGLGILMCQARLLFWSSENSGWPDTATTWSWLLLATLLLLLAHFVYRAHNWARLTVIALCVCLCIFFIWGSISAELNWAHMLAQSNEWKLWRQIESATQTFGMSLSMSLAPLLFVIGVLCQRDVAASFRPPITERSTHAMQ